MIVYRVLILSLYYSECGKSLVYLYNQTLEFLCRLFFLFVTLYFACIFSMDIFLTVHLRIGPHVVINNHLNIRINNVNSDTFSQCMSSPDLDQCKSNVTYTWG